MESNDQDEWVKKLEQKLNELREQRIKVDEANETLRKKLQTLTTHIDTLDTKYGKHETEIIKDESAEGITDAGLEKTTTETENKISENSNTSESADK